MKLKKVRYKDYERFEGMCAKHLSGGRFTMSDLEYLESLDRKYDRKSISRLKNDIKKRFGV